MWGKCWVVRAATFHLVISFFYKPEPSDFLFTGESLWSRSLKMRPGAPPGSTSSTRTRWDANSSVASLIGSTAVFRHAPNSRYSPFIFQRVANVWVSCSAPFLDILLVLKTFLTHDRCKTEKTKRIQIPHVEKEEFRLYLYMALFSKVAIQGTY